MPAPSRRGRKEESLDRLEVVRERRAQQEPSCDNLKGFVEKWSARRCRLKHVKGFGNGEVSVVSGCARDGGWPLRK